MYDSELMFRAKPKVLYSSYYPLETFPTCVEIYLYTKIEAWLQLWLIYSHRAFSNLSWAYLVRVRSDTIQRRFTIAKSLLSKADKSSFDRLCGQVGVDYFVLPVEGYKSLDVCFCALWIARISSC